MAPYHSPTPLLTVTYHSNVGSGNYWMKLEILLLLSHFNDVATNCDVCGMSVLFLLYPIPATAKVEAQLKNYV